MDVLACLARRRRLLLRLLLYGGGIFLGIPLAFSHVMTRTYRSGPLAPPPAGFEPVALVSEGLRLRAWLSRSDLRRPAFVIVHGLGDSLESYLPHASVLRSRGHSVLLLDLRGHGGSQGSRTTLGGREQADVRAAMAFLRDAGLARAGLGLLGHSMGAVAVLLAAAGEPDVHAVIVEAPYDTYRNTIAHHARLLYHLPEWTPLIPTAIAFAELWADFDADAVDAVAAARRVRAPLFAIADGDDPRMPEAVVRRVYDAHPGPKRFWVAAGVGHVGAVQLADYPQRVLAFLDESGVR